MENTFAEETIVIKIKEQRKIKGLSHENIAYELGVSPSTYNKIEREETKLTLERFLQLQQILGISIEDFFEIKPNNIYHQEVKDNATGVNHQEVENLYQENKDLNNTLICSLQDEIQFLRDQLTNKS